jgi:hypothetical protein
MSQTIQNRLGVALGALALFIALGGESFAKNTVHSILKTGVVTGKMIRNGTIRTADLDKSLRKQLAKVGPMGPGSWARPVLGAGDHVDPQRLDHDRDVADNAVTASGELGRLGRDRADAGPGRSRRQRDRQR